MTDKANDFVPSGASDHEKSGRSSAPSQVNRAGISSPTPKPSTFSFNAFPSFPGGWPAPAWEHPAKASKASKAQPSQHMPKTGHNRLLSRFINLLRSEEHTSELQS